MQKTAGNVTYLTGTIALAPVRYWIESERVPRRWWLGAVETYKVCTEFMSHGGYRSREEAHFFARQCGFEWARGF